MGSRDVVGREALEALELRPSETEEPPEFKPRLLRCEGARWDDLLGGAGE